MAKVIPAILTGDSDSLSETLRQVESFTDEVQIDVMDGVFVPSRSVGAQVLSAIKFKLPHEAHLMVSDPDKFAAPLLSGGFSRAIFHVETTSDPKRAIKTFKSLGLEVGIALNPETDIEQIFPLINDVSLVLILTVEPGFYGSPFIPEVLTKVRSLRAANSFSTIGVDGGINEKNIGKAVQAGADRIYVGSHVFLTRDPKAEYQKLNRMAHGE